jgi:hypothetical protein
MAGTAHRAVRDALVALLQASPALADGGVTANRKRPMAAQHGAQVFVFLEDALPERGGILGAPIDWSDLARAVFARVQDDITLGGLVMDCVPQGMVWTEDETSPDVAACQLMFQCLHRTLADSIAAEVDAVFNLLTEAGDALLTEAGDLILME